MRRLSARQLTASARALSSLNLSQEKGLLREALFFGTMAGDYDRTGHREAQGGHRPRAAPIDRRAGHGPLGRYLRRGAGRSDRLADDAGLPDPRPLRAGGRQQRLRDRGRDLGRGRLRRPQPGREIRPPAAAWPQRAARGRPRPGQERDLRRLRQGRSRQVDDDREPGGRTPGDGPGDGRAGLRRLRLLDPEDARRRPAAARGQRPAKDHPAALGDRRQGDVDRLLRRGELGGRLARSDAAQGDPAVPRRRRLGRARLPAARSAAGNGRRLDDSRPARCPRRRS